MPVYTYECDNCGQRFEAKQSFKDEPLTECPNCGGSLHRVIQPVGVVFKGSGFYVTDSRGKQNLATAGTKKEDGAKSSDSGSESTSSGDGAKTTTDAAAKSDSAAKPAETTKTTSTDSK
jgi:putative FmdB family regulatory protein